MVDTLKTKEAQTIETAKIMTWVEEGTKVQTHTQEIAKIDTQVEASHILEIPIQAMEDIRITHRTTRTPTKAPPRSRTTVRTNSLTIRARASTHHRMPMIHTNRLIILIAAARLIKTLINCKTSINQILHKAREPTRNLSLRINLLKSKKLLR